MKILLTGANGYIGKRLLMVFADAGFEVIALMRTKGVNVKPEYQNKIKVVYADLFEPKTLANLPKDIDVAYFLVHLMAKNTKDLVALERESAKNFVTYLDTTSCKQVVFLSGMGQGEQLSPHLLGRRAVEEELKKAKCATTVFRSGIIIGSGSASFEIIRDLVEKLPVMTAPSWINNINQPIGIYDVIDYLFRALNNQKAFDKTFEIGGKDVLSFKEMMLTLAKLRGLKRYILSLPVLSLRMSSYWLYFVTATDISLAKHLVQSMSADLVVRDKSAPEIFNKELLGYEEALERTFGKIAQNEIVSSWKDSWRANKEIAPDLSLYLEAPQRGCFKDKKEKVITDAKYVKENIWRLGGENGWYYMDWAWAMRGFVDKLFGGVGLRRGRRHPYELHAGECLDFWRVITADKENGHLLLYAEMKLPGEAWLEFNISKKEGELVLTQTATFRPKGLLGRLYWYILVPFHIFIFQGMIDALTSKR